MRKTLLLIVLGIPVMIAVLLKFFGENKYDIPVYFSQGISDIDRNLETTDQYVVPDFIMIDNKPVSWQDKISIIFFLCDSNQYSSRSVHELERVFSTNRDSERIKIYALNNQGDLLEIPDSIQFIKFKSDDLYTIATCSLLINESESYEGNSVFETIVMIDNKGRIRGYYDSSDIAEYDRITAEADILKSEIFGGR